jgi:hypothetical protein
VAAAKAPDVRLLHADMRRLERLGAFDLVTCLDDALNYLLDAAGLEAALRGIGRNLAPGGVAVWDVNTVAMYRSAFASDRVEERDGVFLAWRGQTARDVAAGGEARATVELFARAGDGAWRRSSSVHRQRHWDQRAIRASARRAGLRILAVHGQSAGAVIHPALDELVHTKAVYLACRDDTGR